MHEGRVEVPGDPGPLQGTRLVTLAVNVPGPVAAARLRELGASVVKIEPPAGDPLAGANPEWYRELARGQEVVSLDLKAAEDRARLDEYLEEADLLLSSSRSLVLSRLGLSWEALHERHPGLSQVAIVGYPAPDENVPGHDLTYQASLGLLTPPDLPRTLLADLAGAEKAVSAALALLVERLRGGEGSYAEVSLAEAAEAMSAPLFYGLTVPGGGLGGGAPEYNLYRSRDGWVALAALEPHFRQRVYEELGLENPGYQHLASVFLSRSAKEWEVWAAERDLPLAAVSEPLPGFAFQQTPEET